jgi:hypothetical protein
MKSKHHKVSGNIMLYVLIGIALFAALSFVISRENKYDSGSSEKAALDAAQITSYAEKINGVVQNLMVQNHCRATQISFTNPASGSCQVFDQSGAGGGMVLQTPPAEAVDNQSFVAAGSPAATQAGKYIFEGNVCVSNIGTSCAASGSALVFIMPWVTQAVCAQINQITSNSTTIPTVSANSFDGTTFIGTFATTYTLTTSGTTNTSGCFKSTAQTNPPGTGYHYYSVLQAN